ncbi:hypothetical protein C2S52_023458 [Perilla frutescens var. hirtella]|nr:hypothetical protein C2S52_023458 [Perilla frutescens var. hirtella]
MTGTWRNNIKNLSPNYQLNHKKVETRGIIFFEKNIGVRVNSENGIDDCIEYIRRLLKTTGDGRISTSSYDTAWVALIEDLEGGDGPQFPSSLEWIEQNQRHDGSWGDDFFCVYDRLLNTIACVVALTSWNVDSAEAKKGVLYIKENVHRLKDGTVEHMPCGFELVFPALLQRAKLLGIQDLPYDDPLINEIYYAREQKLKRIPIEVMHKVPTSLLFSLEGMENLEWEKLLKFQSTDGSFLTSPSSTAFAFMQTKDEKCFKFIKNVVQTFNGVAPNAYPVDIYARLWAVDRLQRLGISRFFEAEIVDCLSHVFRFWTEKGVFCARETQPSDMDDTTMGFRLLRMHGYDVDPNVLRNFKHDDKFSCLAGPMIESPSPIYNLYRASQIRFPGEDILEEANKFAYQFLQQNLGSNIQIIDKWVISKHLPDEIRLGLEMPWYATLPRVEARYYMQHYAGSDEVWIGKNLFRMPEISNDTYLYLAKMDFKRCQHQHISEWTYMQEWYGSYNIEEFGMTSRKDLLLAYFLATASIFELERQTERIAWAKSVIISKMIASFFSKEATSLEEKRALSEGFRIIHGLHKTESTAKREHRVVDTVLETIHQFLEGFDKHTSHQLKNVWGIWWKKLQQGEATNRGADTELLTNTLNICGENIAFKEEILSHEEYINLSNLTNKICQQLTQIEAEKDLEMDGEITVKSCIKNKELEHDMQALVKLVLEESVGINKKMKLTFLSVAKTYYYMAYTAAETVETHIFKVLFEPLV